MNRGLYNNASGLFNAVKQMEVKSQNVSNLNTTAYKYDNHYSKVIEDVLISHKGKDIGILPTKIGTDSIDTVYTQGNMINTSRALDVAIQGDAFFKVENGKNGYSYTRDGALNIDSSGNLTDSKGNYIVGDNGRIKIPGDVNTMSIKEDGSIFVNDNFIDKIKLVELDNPTKVGNNYYKASAERDSNSLISQGYLESSNVDMGKEMADIILIQHYMSSNQKALMTHDELNKKIIGDIG